MFSDGWYLPFWPLSHFQRYLLYFLALLPLRAIFTMYLSLGFRICLALVVLLVWVLRPTSIHMIVGLVGVSTLTSIQITVNGRLFWMFFLGNSGPYLGGVS
nr:hypothetical protein [Tanacetum cinerariifolium]